MARCRYCDQKIAWGQGDDGKWVKLVPIGEDDGLDRTHQDENGVLRAQHACAGWTPAVKVVKLAKPVEADAVLPVPQKAPTVNERGRRRRRAGRQDSMDDSIPF